MADPDERMFETVVSAILRETGCDRPVFQANRFEIGEGAAEDIRSGLLGRVLKIAEPSLSHFFLEYLNEEDTLDLYLENSEAAALGTYREAFVRNMTASGCGKLKARLPSLFLYIQRVAGLYLAFIGEMLERLDSSFDEICSGLLGGAVFRVLTGISADSGDTHHFGRATSVLSTDAGNIVYKPHDIQIDFRSGELIDRFFSDIMRAPRTVVREGYGFTEFIRNEPADTGETAAAYFYNLGGFTAVVQMMGAADLHHSNVLASGVFPVIIDYELMVLPSDKYTEKSLGEAFQYSLYYSSLMPSRRADTEMSILFGRDPGNRSAPVVDGIRKIMPDYPDAFFRGFRDIYTRCMEKREEIRAMVSSWKGIVVRHIYRNTSVYGELQQKILEPGWLRDETLKDHLFEKLSVAMKRRGVENADAITEAETEALLRGDIPYFYSRTDSRDLYADGKAVFQDFFRVTGLEHLLSRIDYLSREDMAFEEALLKKAMGKISSQAPGLTDSKQPITGKIEITDEALLSHAEQFFRDIAADAFYTSSGDVCWFGPDYFLQTGMKLLDSGLIDGTAGLAVFFAALHSLTMDGEVKTEAARLLEKIISRLESSADALDSLEIIHPNTEDVSLATGLTGKLLGVRRIAQYWEGDRCRSLCRKMLSLAQKVDLQYEGVDIISGLSGLLKLLCTYDDFFSAPGIPPLCERLADRIMAAADIPYEGKRLWKTLSPAWALSGAGHGQSGIASALWLAGQRLDRKDLTEAALTGFGFEDRIYSEKIGAWPDRRLHERTDNYMTGYCSGAPGIGLNALLLPDDAAGHTVRRAIDSCLRQPLQYKDYLCCGNSAIIDFLLEAGLRTQDPELVEEARTRMAMVIDRAAETGHFNCVPEKTSPLFSPCLFYGLSGIGYEMLRLTAPDRIGSILL